jgi:hypothetical protein
MPEDGRGWAEEDVAEPPNGGELVYYDVTEE